MDFYKNLHLKQPNHLIFCCNLKRQFEQKLVLNSVSLKNATEKISELTDQLSCALERENTLKLKFETLKGLLG